MIRFLTLSAFLLGVLALSQTTLHAQDADLPVAAPDEIIFVGEVPAPPGTQVTIDILSLSTGEFVECAAAATSSLGSDTRSAFLVSLDAACAADATVGPRICWGPDDCHVFIRSSQDPILTGGITLDLGALERDVRSDIVPPEEANVDLLLPATGGGDQDDTSTGWLLWAGVSTIIVGLSLATASSVLARRSRQL